jgi:hypothetical protein
LLSNTTITGPAPDNPPAPAQAVAKPATAKRPPAAAQIQESQKKQAVEGKLASYKAVMNQTVVTDTKQCKKVIMTVALPGNVQGVKDFTVEFAPALNGGGLLKWVLRGMVNANTDKLATVLAKLECKGITSGDAILFAQALETKLMDKRKNKHAAIYDLFLIPLEVQCNVNKQPMFHCFGRSIS